MGSHKKMCNHRKENHASGHRRKRYRAVDLIFAGLPRKQAKAIEKLANKGVEQAVSIFDAVAAGIRLAPMEEAD